MYQRNVRFNDRPQQRLIATNRTAPLPYPEPPRVINPRPFVPDLSIVSEPNPVTANVGHGGGHTATRPVHSATRPTQPMPTPAPQLFQHRPFAYGHNQPPQQTAANYAGDFNPHTQQLVLREGGGGGDVISPIAKRDHQYEIYQLVKQHDEQLQLIADKVQELLRLNQCNTTTTTPKAIRPQMACAETMTSMTWPTPPSSHRSSARQQQSELARSSKSNDSDVYEDMLSNIDDILRASDQSDLDLTRSSCSSSRDGPSAETIYINRLASKYLEPKKENAYPSSMVKRTKTKSNYDVRFDISPRVQQTAPKVLSNSNSNKGRNHNNERAYDVRITGTRRHEISTSIATKNYLEKYGLLNDGDDHDTEDRGGTFDLETSSVLDIDKLKRQAKYK